MPTTDVVSATDARDRRINQITTALGPPTDVIRYNHADFLVCYSSDHHHVDVSFRGDVIITDVLRDKDTVCPDIVTACVVAASLMASPR